ncbi:MAG: elongation factor maturation arginine rhamnosyltransferase EarP [Pseudomonadota bacterium]|jgi:uncharacterized repeat protein (TIGR03837 family)
MTEDLPCPETVVPPGLRRWDVFCRVIDNHGDLGVCWRLARDLAGRGAQVRLWVDDASALAWMAPDGSPGVEVLPWRDPLEGEVPGDVVVEAFGCDPPPAFVARMAAAARPPHWINLEYLSAEPWVERAHRLASPQWHGPGRGLTKWFFYPGFTDRTGGLLREPGLLARRDAHHRETTLARLGLRLGADDPPDHALMLLFGYAQPRLPAWLDLLAAGHGGARAGISTTLLVTPGHSARQVGAWLAGRGLRRSDAGREVGALRLHFLPHVSQVEFDRLLWACDLNLVRGEDSAVRALWAGRPMLWQLYPQDDGAHEAKLEAFLAQALDDAPAPLADAVGEMARLWNGLGPAERLPQAWARLWPALRAGWRRAAEARSHRWASQPDLTTQMIAWAAHAGPSPC